ncbi:MAG: hypothetical protein ACOZNI_25390 [Myxococcota bacterium]
MLQLLTACLVAAEPSVTDFHDDAGWVVGELAERGCSVARPCAVWDTGRFADGPPQIAVGRPCRGCATPAKLAGVLGDSFEGTTAVLARENPLFVTLAELGCADRDACHVAVAGDTLLLVSRATNERRSVLATR